jgi:hypothetical protein
VHSFAGDDPIACRDYVRERLALDRWTPSAREKRALSKRIIVPATPDRDWARQKLIAAGMRIWGECCDPRGTVVERYLASRYLDLDSEVTDAIRFHPGLAYDGARLPAMVALMRDVKTNEPCGIHRTWLDHDGRKIARRMLGRAKGAAIKLDDDLKVTNALTIGEGIETCLTARQCACGPVWAVGSVVAIQAFPILPEIEVLNVLGEVDDGGASMRAFEVAAERRLGAGRDVFVYVPSAGDMNDALVNHRERERRLAGGAPK